ncbi:PQQ-binding-like beta-propeller repeat protein [Ktedonospora formicarum]|uniref:Pyrrolo-quinoline quinone repeat domain-containing protein n=1 Tax=Ktedonospora formicarum TaxID=2778364 RepID=A0A8J3IDL8_9CHLR|nr:PQQ-binding-like beta-propeller repeat protein [Ktedonospora formicarum]GHO50358.1 hypothetical protein KSX_85210 [Ktedonospora formicarum]
MYQYTVSSRKVTLALRYTYSLIALLFMYLLAGCGSQEGASTKATSTPSPQKQEARCSINNNNNQSAHTLYAVSWDAIAKDADNNQGTSTLHVTAFDTQTGKQLWQKVPTQITTMYQSSRQKVVDGVLYILASTYQKPTLLLAVDTKDGHLLWQREYKQSDIQIFEICAGQIYLAMAPTDTNAKPTVSLHALSAKDGEERWVYASEEMRFLSSLIATKETLFATELRINTDQINVIALHPEDGKVSWRKEYYNKGEGEKFKLLATETSVIIIRQIDPNPTYTGISHITSVQGLEPSSGKVTWETHMPVDVGAMNAVALGVQLYLSGLNFNPKAPKGQEAILMRLDVNTGKLLWHRFHNYNQLTLISSQEMIYAYKGYGNVPTPQKELCALDPASGKEHWCQKTLQPSLFSLNTSQNTVIAVEAIQPGPMELHQNLVALSKQDGHVLWQQRWKTGSSKDTTVTLVTTAEGQDTQTIAVF